MPAPAHPRPTRQSSASLWPSSWRVALARVLVTGLLGVVGGAHAQVTTGAEQVWRCTSASGGDTLYSQRPCNADAQALPLSRAPSSQARKEAARVSARERRLASQLSQDREGRARQQAGTPPAATSLSGPVRQVSVGPRSGPGSRQAAGASRSNRSTRPHRMPDGHDGHFRAKTPRPPRSASPAPSVTP